MINKIVKFFEKTRLIISASLIIVIASGIFIYKEIGVTPIINLSKNSNNISIVTNTYKDGEDISLAFPKGGRINDVYVKVGDTIEKGQKLASLDYIDAEGVLNQAESALELAKANYEKLINGATNPDLEVLRASLAKTESNLITVENTQNTLVSNALHSLMNSSLEAVPENPDLDYSWPIISGSYNSNKEGVIKIHPYYSSGGISFTVQGLATGTGMVKSENSQPLGDSGLFIKFPSSSVDYVTDWIVNIPNKKAANYLTNYNAYKSALATRDQLITSAKADVEQAKANLNSKIASARSEDISIAKAQMDSAEGALKIARGAYNNNFIYAPESGVITVINIKKGEIALTNQKAIVMTVKIKD